MPPLDPTPSNLSGLRQAIATLPLPKQRELRNWLDELIAAAESEALLTIPKQRGREVVEQKQVGKVTYQHERVKCGKQGCKCGRGELYGPGYVKSGNRLKSWYIGKVWREPDNSEL